MLKGKLDSSTNRVYNSEALKSSHGYNGQGTATYPNGDKYAGTFADGVS